MSFGQTPLSNTSLGTNQFPASAVAVPNTANGDFTALEGGPASIDSNNNKTAPASIYVKDGNDVTGGSMIDAAVTDATQTTKSRMAFLKGAVKIFADIWDSTNHWLQVKVMNVNANGQATMFGSAPVTIASDQTAIKAIPYKQISNVLYSTTQTGVNTWSGSGDITGLSGYTELYININFSGTFTGTSVQFKVTRKDSFGAYITIDSALTVSGTGTQTRSIGAGLNVTHSFGNIVVISATFNAMTTCTFTLDVFAK